jgi:ABC-type amino acid transport substrate-binding protein
VAEELRALANQEIDAVFGDKAQLWLWSRKPEGHCCEVMGQDVKDTQTLGIGVAAGLRREDVKLREALNKAFAEMMSDGTYKKLNEKYFPFSLN